jgi:hypothetical protein
LRRVDARGYGVEAALAMTSLNSGCFLYWASTCGQNGSDLEAVGGGVPDHVLDQGHRRARAAHARRRFGVVGADQRWAANGEVEFGFAVDAVDPADITAARPRYALFDADGFVHAAVHINQLSMVCYLPRGWQRREFVAVVGRKKVEKAATPVGFAPLLLGGFDPVPARRDKVPPDVAGPSERRAAEDDETRAGGTGRDADTVPRSKHHHPAGLERLARDRDRPFDQVDAAILVIVGQRQERTGLEIGIRVEGYWSSSSNSSLIRRADWRVKWA